MEYMTGASFDQKKKMIKAALYDYLKWCEIRPDLVSNKGVNGNNDGDGAFVAGKMSVDPTRDDMHAVRCITRLAKLLASLRGIVMTWEKEGSGFNPEFDHGTITVENSTRATTSLRNLAYGLAHLEGRNYIEMADVIHVIKVVMSTTSIERSRIFLALIDSDGKLKTRDIERLLSITEHPARRTMTELDALELVKKVEEDDELCIRLRRKFKWFLSSEFKKMYYGFLPNVDDNTFDDFMKQLETKKIEEARENQPIFDNEFQNS
jgi:hypothetical protein